MHDKKPTWRWLGKNSDPSPHAMPCKEAYFWLDRTYDPDRHMFYFPQFQSRPTMLKSERSLRVALEIPYYSGLLPFLKFNFITFIQVFKIPLRVTSFDGSMLVVAHKTFTSLPPGGGELKTWKEQHPNQGQKRLSTPSERWTPDSELLTFEHRWVPTFRFQLALHPPHLLLKSDLTGCENLKDLTSVHSSSPSTLRCRWPRCDSWFTDDHYSG